jgi:hypothetical protein
VPSFCQLQQQQPNLASAASGSHGVGRSLQFSKSLATDRAGTWATTSCGWLVQSRNATMKVCCGLLRCLAALPESIFGAYCV